MSTGWLWQEIYGWHDTGTPAGDMFGPGMQPLSHYESAQTKTRFASLAEVSGIAAQLTRLRDVTPANERDLLRVHTQAHVTNMQTHSRNHRGGDMGDGISPFGQGGYDIACWSAGGTMAAMRAVLDGTVDNAYALVRPPGHHARPDTGMGFCMFANIPVAIAQARAELGLGRVAVVDWDVHHGNGTEACFYDDPDVLTISMHQDGNFPPDTGKIADRGTGDGFGTALNIPLPAGSGDGAYQYAVAEVVLPALRQFAPDLIVVASGFDASNADPLGRMLLTSTSYRRMTQQLLDTAADLCNGRLLINHEGGYSPVYVPFCGLAVLETLSGIDSGINDPNAELWDGMPGQELLAHQAAVVDNVRELLTDVPRPAQANRTC